MELILTVGVVALATLVMALAPLLTGRVFRPSCGVACEGACATCPRRRSERSDG